MMQLKSSRRANLQQFIDAEKSQTQRRTNSWPSKMREPRWRDFPVARSMAAFEAATDAGNRGNALRTESG